MNSYTSKCRCIYNDDSFRMLSPQGYKIYTKISIVESRAIANYERKHSDFLNILYKSKFTFDPITYYILDIKFKTWLFSIVNLGEIIKQAYLHENPYTLLKEQIEELYNETSEIYTAYINQIKSKNEISDISVKIIDIFLENHKHIYNVFKTEFLNYIDDFCKDHNECKTQIHTLITKYTTILIKVMELTTVEIASINRLLVDNSVYVTLEVINWIKKYDYNLVDMLKKLTKKQSVNIIYAEPEASRFETLLIA